MEHEAQDGAAVAEPCRHAAHKELATSSKAGVNSGRIPAELKDRLERWRATPSILTAAELIETAIVEKQEGEAVNAARAVLNTYANAAPLIKRQAAHVLLRANRAADVPPEFSKATDQSLSVWRRRTRAYPLDALAWVELALHYVIGREPEKADRCMTIALQLAPEMRRSRCRSRHLPSGGWTNFADYENKR
jgi:hypothetical protein